LISCILAMVCGLFVVGADRLTKYLISSNMELGDSADFISGFIRLDFIYNTGGAWGMLSGYTWVLLAATLVVMLICITILIKSGTKSKILFWAICLVLSGGIGNMIDRIFNDGKVIDFLHFEFFPQFPIFNVADIAVVVGAGLLILYFVLDIVKEQKDKKAKKDIKETENEQD